MATRKMQIYKCDVCGIIVEVVHGGGGKLVCCGKPMAHCEENTVDAAVEKHKPVIEKIDGGYKVAVGDVDHPMEQDHYIEWIELIADGKTCFAYLNPGDKPVATFRIEADNVTARAYCNLHGLWKN